MSVVVGYVNTPQGRAAVDAAVREARLRETALVVVHSMVGDEPADVVMEYREVLEALRRRLTAEGLEPDIREYARGHAPPEDLLTVAEELDAELIVIGLRQRSQVGKLILGSNAAEIILHARCPVLAVKAPD